MPDHPPEIAGCRYLTADFGHLLHAAHGAPRDWKGPYPSMREAWRGFTASFGDGWRSYHQQAADPLPGVAEPLTFLSSRLRGRSR